MKAMLSVLALLMVLTSCASQEKSDVEKRVAQEPKKADSQSLGTTIHDLINSSKTLNDAQKKELTDIFAANKSKAEELTNESFRVRTVLIKELLSGNVNKKELNLIKKDIKRIEGLRLKNTFDTVERVSKIVSKHPDNEKYIDHLIYMERFVR